MSLREQPGQQQGELMREEAVIDRPGTKSSQQSRLKKRRQEEWEETALTSSQKTVDYSIGGETVTRPGSYTTEYYTVVKK